MTLQYIPIETLEQSMNIVAVYQMLNYQIRAKKDGGQFVSMLLSDSSGRIQAMLWDNIEGFVAGKYADNDFLEVSGSVQSYNNQLQLRATRVRKVPLAEVEVSRFLQCSPRDQAEMIAELKKRVESIEDEDYRSVVASVFSNKELAREFSRGAAAVMMHHAYIHGLLEHTLSVAATAMRIAEGYPRLDKSLLLAAALLHDIGKTMEYCSDYKIELTDAGRLIGHISAGSIIVEKHCSRFPDMPATKKMLLLHCILSHHGEYEFGSPKRPKIPEALVLHIADLIDSQLAGYYEKADDVAQKGTGKWEQMFMFQRQMFLREDLPVEGADLIEKFTQE